MSQAPIILERTVHFAKVKQGRKKLKTGTAPEKKPPARRIPRVTRLLALAIRFEEMLAQGHSHDYADLARIFSVDRSRISQIMTLRLLAPDLQEHILNLTPCEPGKEPLLEKELLKVAREANFERQRVVSKHLFTAVQ